MWWLLGGCALAAAACGAGLGRLLHALPEPADASGKTPYARLDTLSFRWMTAGFALCCSLIVVATVTWPTTVIWLPLCTVGVIAVAIDARTTYLPRVLTLAATGATVVCVAAASLVTANGQLLIDALIGAATLGGLFLILWAVTRGFGFGDVRLAVAVGATAGTLGLTALLSSALLGSLVGVVWGLVQHISDRRAGRTPGPFPYGPSILIGPFVYLAATLVNSWFWQIG